MSNKFKVLSPTLHLLDFRSETCYLIFIITTLHPERIGPKLDHLKNKFGRCARPNSKNRRTLLFFILMFFHFDVFDIYSGQINGRGTASKLQRRWEMRRALEQASDEAAGR